MVARNFKNKFRRVRRAIRRKAPAVGRGRRGRRLQFVKDQAGLAMVKAAAGVGASAMRAYRGTKVPFVKKRNDDDNSGGYIQWSSRQYKKTFGRLTQAKVNKLQMDRIIFVWRRLRNTDDGLGTLWINNYWTAGSAAALPIYIFELDSVINEQQGNIVSANPMWTLQRSDAGVYSWVNVNGRSPVTDVDSPSWTTERAEANATNSSIHPRSASLFRWADIRMDCWGMKNHPCKFVLELCQLKEEVVPGGSIDDNVGRFWDSQLRPFISNPNFSQPGYGDRSLKKILDRKEFHMNPTSTTESDPDPHCRSVKLFYWFNRMCRYDWKDATTVGERVTNANYPNFVSPRVVSDNQLQTHPNARLFFMIRATKFVRSPTELSQTNADTPSISIQVRCNHMVVD